MQELSKIPPSQLEKLSSEKHGSIVLNELNREDVIAHIAGLLHEIAGLYQIQNWGVEQSVKLAGWVFRNYKYEQLKNITECLSNPPIIEEKIWRLTPDVISSWLVVHLDCVAEERENVWQNQKKEKPDYDPGEISEETKKLIDQTVQALNATKTVPLITDTSAYKRQQIINEYAEKYGVTRGEMTIHYNEWEKEKSELTFSEWLLK